MDDARLREISQRSRKRIGIQGDKPPVAPQVFEVECAYCHRPIQLIRQPGPFCPAVPKGRLVHTECLAAAEQDHEREKREAADLAKKKATEAVAANPGAALAQCGVPSHWREASLCQSPDLPGGLLDALRGYAANPGGILYLFGTPGAGKTWAAVAVLREILLSGALPLSQCRFLSERSYLDGLKAAFANGNGGDKPQRALPEGDARRIGLLVYDDLASERQTEWTRSEIAKLVEMRHAADLPTLITSNIEPDALAQAIDGRLASRIAETRLMLKFPSRDLRIKGTPQQGNAPCER